jgi:hypothetical protein
MHRKQELSGPCSREGREHSRLAGVPGRFEASARPCRQVAVSASADCSRIQSRSGRACSVPYLASAWPSRQAHARPTKRHPVPPTSLFVEEQ